MATRDGRNRLEGALPRFSDYLKKWTDAMPDKPVFYYHDNPISFKDFSHDVEQLAKYLLKIGVQKGERLGYIMNGRPEFFTLYLAAARIGAIIAGMNVRNTAHEMEYVINNSEPSHIMTLHSLGDMKFQDTLAKALPNCPSVNQLWVVGGPAELPNAISYEEILKGDYSDYDDALKKREQEVGPDDGLIIIYTSGTTGQPKGALLTHGNIVSSGLVQADEFCPPTGLQPGMNIIHGAPVNHVSGATEWGATPLIAGCTQICNDYFDPVLALKQSEMYKVPLMAGVPAMWGMMFGLPDFEKYDLSSVRFCMIGGSMAPYPILEKMKKLTPYCCNPCGMSEVTGLSTYSDIGASVENLHLTVGKCAPEFEMRVVDAQRKPVPDGTPGEIAYRGPSRMKEYWRMPEATAATIDEEGWLYSGDAGIVDENGDLRIIGRLKEMFITGGFNVYPAEIEDQISKYPGVAMVAVVGIPHELMGEVGRAYIVPKPGVKLEGEEIQKYLKEYLADYKIPRNYVLKEALPMTLLGKIEKKILRQEVEKEFAK